MIKDVQYQVEAVKELVKKTRELLAENGTRKKLVFKAPTGSGKTVMASKMLDELTTELEQDGQEVAIIWIAPNKLHQQSYFRMKNYFSETRALSPVMYDELDHSIGGYIKPGEIFFVNWESIHKDTNVMVRDTETSSSLYDLTRRTQEDHHLPIIVVIDEEHIFTSKAATQSEKVLANIQPKLEIRISATPITTAPDAMVAVSREKVIKAQMIKNGITINPKITEVQEGLNENEILLDKALGRRNEIKKAYEALGVRINPLLLIQLPNDDSDKLNADETLLIEEVKARLAAKYEITAGNGKLAVWLSNEKTNLDGLEEPNNVAEVLLFKQAIALGWDCPRAAVLLIFRDIQSTTFGVQTVGRILRMPEQKYYPNDLLNRGWVYTNLESTMVVIKTEDLNYISKPLKAERRKNLANVELPAEYSERLSADRNRIGADFGKVLANTANSLWFSHKIQMQFDFSEEGEKTKPANNPDGYLPGLSKLDDEKIADNREKAEALGIDFSGHRIQTNDIPVDMDITGEAGEFQVEQGKVIKYARTQAELEWALTKFCKKLLNGYESQSAVSMRGYIYTFMEEMLGVFEVDAPKIILYNKNRSHFVDLFKKAIDAYTKKVNERRAKAKNRSFKLYHWLIPEFREYNESTNKEVPAHIHALVPFIRQNGASMPEQRFEAFLEANRDYIDWWYKNGESGKQDYAVGYTKAQTGERSLFYVDFIIRMKNGQVFLFDTKSQASDIDAPAKHNALLAYMKDSKNAHLQLMGGVIIQQGENWLYSPLPIENTDDITNWDAFQPDQYEKRSEA
ncbi:MAG: DEAD/DEAH box helicase family protein [Victivallales bacterium]|nr:DEAD/DEAH box helicase family protein [Victivallales bacterium]